MAVVSEFPSVHRPRGMLSAVRLVTERDAALVDPASRKAPLTQDPTMQILGGSIGAGKGCVDELGKRSSLSDRWCLRVHIDCWTISQCRSNCRKWQDFAITTSRSSQTLIGVEFALCEDIVCGGGVSDGF